MSVGMRDRRCVLILGFVASLAMLAPAVAADADAASVGKALRARLDALFQWLRSDKKIASGVRGNDISALVREYSPPGMSFVDAEQVLRSAGFRVYPRPSAPDPVSGSQREHVSAIL